MKDCEHAADDSADSLLSEGAISSDNSGLLLGADNENLVSRAPLEGPGMKPLWVVFDPETEIVDELDALLMMTTFGEETGATVAVGYCRLFRPKGNKHTS